MGAAVAHSTYERCPFGSLWVKAPMGSPSKLLEGSSALSRRRAAPLGAVANVPVPAVQVIAYSLGLAHCKASQGALEATSMQCLGSPRSGATPGANSVAKPEGSSPEDHPMSPCCSWERQSLSS